MKLLKNLSIIVGVLALVVMAAAMITQKMVSDRILAAGLSGTQEGQQQGELAGSQEGRSFGESAGSEAGYTEGTNQGKTEGSTAGNQAGSEAGNDDGTAKGEHDGASKGAAAGSTAGYDAGKTEGTSLGYADGFAAETGTGYLVRNPTYNEAKQLMAQTSKTNAGDINVEIENRGFRVGYTGYKLASLPNGYYEAVSFDTIDNGIVYFSCSRHIELELEVGKRYSDLNEFAQSNYDDTITTITTIW